MKGESRTKFRNSLFLEIKQVLQFFFYIVHIKLFINYKFIGIYQVIYKHMEY